MNNDEYMPVSSKHPTLLECYDSPDGWQDVEES